MSKSVQLHVQASDPPPPKDETFSFHFYCVLRLSSIPFIKMLGIAGFKVKSNKCIGCTVTIKCLVSQWRCERWKCYLFDVKLGHIWCLFCVSFPPTAVVSSTSRTECKLIKVFHTRLLLTVHWLLSVIGTHGGKTELGGDSSKPASLQDK